MNRKICWTDKIDGVKREIRVELTGRLVKWQFKRKDEGSWDYDRPPTAEEWDALEERVTKRMQRGKRGQEGLDIIKRLRDKQGV
jgi:hypothetical protein